MFEDLIPTKKKVTTNNDRCYNCGSIDLANTDGQFIPNGYVVTVVCKKCGSKWFTTYDGDLNIVNIQNGS